MDPARTNGLIREVAKRPATAAVANPIGTSALVDRFAAKLADLKGKQPSAAPSELIGHTTPRGLKGEQRRVVSVRERGDDERGDADRGGHEPASGVRAHAAAVPSAPAAEIVPVQPGVLEQAVERMAAVIAEARDAGAGNIMRVDFPQELAQGLATRAVVARDAATGALSIRVLASGAMMSDGRRSNLEDELRRNLERRRLRVAAIAIEGPKRG